MPTTKYKLAEQIIERLRSTRRATTSPSIEAVIELVGQTASRALKVQHFQEVMNVEDERVPSGLMLATYDSIPVTAYHGRAKAELPAVPIQLPRGLGIFQVVPIITGVPDFSCECIPVGPGQGWMLQGDSLVSGLAGDIGYENYGTTLQFMRNITTDDRPVTAVMVRLAIVDLSRITDHDLLPVPQDVEEVIIRSCLEILGGQAPAVEAVDPKAENPAKA